MTQGAFVVVDGTDGSGKTSIVALLVEKLQQEGYSVFSTEEATRSEFGLAMRALIREIGALDPWTLQMLFIADRVDHRWAIQCAISSGQIVVCDRYWYSGVAFGVYDICAKLPESNPDDVRRVLIALHKQLPLPIPDVALVMSVPAHIAIKRIVGRVENTFLKEFESEEAIARVLREFSLLFEDGSFPEMRLIDNSGELLATFAHVWEIVEPIFHN